MRAVTRVLLGQAGFGASAAIAWAVLANLVPVVGVLFLGWHAGDVLVVYWLENLVIGGFAVARIATARGTQLPGNVTINGRSAAAVPRWLLVPFFCGHYGIFALVHGVFTWILASGAGLAGSPLSWAATVVLLVVAHASEYRTRWVRDGERDRTSPIQAMFAPYKRVVLLHITLIAGVFLLLGLGAAGRVLPVVLLVLAKTAVDLWARLRGQRSPQDAPTLPEAPTVPTTEPAR